MQTIDDKPKVDTRVKEEFKIEKLPRPIKLTHRHRMAGIETIITHAYDASTVILEKLPGRNRRAKLVAGIPLNFGELTEINLGPYTNHDVSTLTMTGSTIESIFGQIARNLRGNPGTAIPMWPEGKYRDTKETTTTDLGMLVGKFEGGAIAFTSQRLLDLTLAHPKVTSK